MKKKLKCSFGLFSLIIAFFTFSLTVKALENDAEKIAFCTQTSKIWQLVGQVFFIIKIIVPIIIIILGSIDLGKSVISGDDKAINKSAMSLLRRAILGVIIFFIPTLTQLLFEMVGKFNKEIKPYYGNCFNCLTSPYSDDCVVTNNGGVFDFKD